MTSGIRTTTIMIKYNNRISNLHANNPKTQKIERESPAATRAQPHTGSIIIYDELLFEI